MEGRRMVEVTDGNDFTTKQRGMDICIGELALGAEFGICEDNNRTTDRFMLDLVIMTL